MENGITPSFRRHTRPVAFILCRILRCLEFRLRSTSCLSLEDTVVTERHWRYQNERQMSHFVTAKHGSFELESIGHHQEADRSA